MQQCVQCVIKAYCFMLPIQVELEEWYDPKMGNRVAVFNIQ